MSKLKKIPKTWILISQSGDNYSDSTSLGNSPDTFHNNNIETKLISPRDSPQRYNITLWPEISLEGCNFDPSRTTAFVIHGFAANGNVTWLSDLKDNYLNAVSLG